MKYLIFTGDRTWKSHHERVVSMELLTLTQLRFRSSYTAISSVGAVAFSPHPLPHDKTGRGGKEKRIFCRHVYYWYTRIPNLISLVILQQLPKRENLCDTHLYTRRRWALSLVQHLQWVLTFDENSMKHWFLFLNSCPDYPFFQINFILLPLLIWIYFFNVCLHIHRMWKLSGKDELEILKNFGMLYRCMNNIFFKLAACSVKLALRWNIALVEFHSLDGNGCKFSNSAEFDVVLKLNVT